MQSDIDDEHPIAFVSKISGKQVHDHRERGRCSRQLYLRAGMIRAIRIFYLVLLQVTAEELIQLVTDNLEDYKRLRGGVHFLDEIPHTDTGKIARRRLREMAANFVRDCMLVEGMQNE